MRGRVIAIGCTDAILTAINENDGIHTCYALNNVSRITGKYKSKGRMKNVNIKKFKRKFKKKRTDVMIVDATDVVDFSKHFVPSSVYMTKENIYLYGKEKTENITMMIDKYQRYQASLEQIEVSDGFLYKIDCTKTKQSRIKDIGYLIKDSWDHVIDLIGDYLIH